jgi:hypothetical protein
MLDAVFNYALKQTETKKRLDKLFKEIGDKVAKDIVQLTNDKVDLDKIFSRENLEEILDYYFDQYLSNILNHPENANTKNEYKEIIKQEFIDAKNICIQELPRCKLLFRFSFEISIQNKIISYPVIIGAKERGVSYEEYLSEKQNAIQNISKNLFDPLIDEFDKKLSEFLNDFSNDCEKKISNLYENNKNPNIKPLNAILKNELAEKLEDFSQQIDKKKKFNEDGKTIQNLMNEFTQKLYKNLNNFNKTFREECKSKRELDYSTIEDKDLDEIYLSLKEKADEMKQKVSNIKNNQLFYEKIDELFQKYYDINNQSQINKFINIAWSLYQTVRNMIFPSQENQNQTKNNKDFEEEEEEIKNNNTDNNMEKNIKNEKAKQELLNKYNKQNNELFKSANTLAKNYSKDKSIPSVQELYELQKKITELNSIKEQIGEPLNSSLNNHAVLLKSSNDKNQIIHLDESGKIYSQIDQVGKKNTHFEFHLNKIISAQLEIHQYCLEKFLPELKTLLKDSKKQFLLEPWFTNSVHKKEFISLLKNLSKIVVEDRKNIDNNSEMYLVTKRYNFLLDQFWIMSASIQHINEILKKENINFGFYPCISNEKLEDDLSAHSDKKNTLSINFDISDYDYGTISVMNGITQIIKRLGSEFINSESYDYNVFLDYIDKCILSVGEVFPQNLDSCVKAQFLLLKEKALFYKNIKSNNTSIFSAQDIYKELDNKIYSQLIKAIIDFYSLQGKSLDQQIQLLISLLDEVQISQLTNAQKELPYHTSAARFLFLKKLYAEKSIDLNDILDACFPLFDDILKLYVFNNKEIKIFTESNPKEYLNEYLIYFVLYNSIKNSALSIDNNNIWINLNYNFANKRNALKKLELKDFLLFFENAIKTFPKLIDDLYDPNNQELYQEMKKIHDIVEILKKVSISFEKKDSSRPDELFNIIDKLKNINSIDLSEITKYFLERIENVLEDQIESFDIKSDEKNKLIDIIENIEQTKSTNSKQQNNKKNKNFSLETNLQKKYFIALGTRNVVNIIDQLNNLLKSIEGTKKQIEETEKKNLDSNNKIQTNLSKIKNKIDELDKQTEDFHLKEANTNKEINEINNQVTLKVSKLEESIKNKNTKKIELDNKINEIKDNISSIETQIRSLQEKLSHINQRNIENEIKEQNEIWLQNNERLAALKDNLQKIKNEKDKLDLELSCENELSNSFEDYKLSKAKYLQAIDKINEIVEDKASVDSNIVNSLKEVKIQSKISNTQYSAATRTKIQINHLFGYKIDSVQSFNGARIYFTLIRDKSLNSSDLKTENYQDLLVFFENNKNHDNVDENQIYFLREAINKQKDLNTLTAIVQNIIKGDIKTFNDQMTIFENEIKNLNISQKNTNAEIESLKKENLDEKRIVISSQITKLENEISKLNSEREKLESEEQKINKEISEIQIQITRLNNDFNEYLENINKINDLNSQISNKEVQIKKSNNKNQEKLKQEKIKLEKELKNLQEETKKLEDSVDENTKEKINLEKQKQALKTKEIKIDKEIIALKKKYTNENNSLSAQKTEQNKELSDLEALSDESKNNLKEYENEAKKPLGPIILDYMKILLSITEKIHHFNSNIEKNYKIVSKILLEELNQYQKNKKPEQKIVDNRQSNTKKENNDLTEQIKDYLAAFYITVHKWKTLQTIFANQTQPKTELNEKEQKDIIDFTTEVVSFVINSLRYRNISENPNNHNITLSTASDYLKNIAPMSHK